MHPASERSGQSRRAHHRALASAAASSPRRPTRPVLLRQLADRPRAETRPPGLGAGDVTPSFEQRQTRPASVNDRRNRPSLPLAAPASCTIPSPTSPTVSSRRVGSSAHGRVVGVAVYCRHLADGAQLFQHAGGGQITRVDDDQVRRAHPRHAVCRQPPVTPGQVRVGDDRNRGSSH
jgi:hypothetical protein